MIRAHRFRLNAYDLRINGRRFNRGEIIEQAPGWDKTHPAGLFTDLGEGDRMLAPGVSARAGIGDCIYAIPSLYHPPGQAPQTTLFVPERSLPIFRCVRDSVAVGEGEADFLQGLEADSEEDLIEQIARALGVSPVLWLPVIETTEAEKLAVLAMQAQRERPYVCVAPWSSDPRRSVQQLKNWAERYLQPMGYDYEWYWADSEQARLLTYMQLVEGAEFIISVGTSAIPVAGALQRPVISLARGRISHFLDAREADMTSLTSVVKGLISEIDWDRCWCGARGGTRSVLANAYLVECPDCGTRRQDVHVTAAGLGKFYVEFYDAWRQVIEGEPSYSQPAKMKHDRDTAKKRIAQWSARLGERWLDIGCGNKALIIELAAAGVEAIGVNDGKRSAGKFDTISYVDVLEHIRDPLQELLDARELLKARGRIIVDLPMVWHESGEPKHIRRLQHIWLWDEATFVTLAAKADLKVDRTICPMGGRMAFVLQKR